MARFTGNGAVFGAAAWPKRSRATLPEVTGPFVGKKSADADGRINPEMTTLSRIWRLTGSIDSSGSVFYRRKAVDEKQKISRLSQGETTSQALKCCSIGYPKRRCSDGRHDARRPSQASCLCYKNFVIIWHHDPHDRVAGDLSHQRNDRTSSGPIERFRGARRVRH